MKTCTKCEKIKEISDFGNRWYRGINIRKSQCKSCLSIAFKKDYYANQEARNAHSRAFYWENKEPRWQAVLDNLGSECACCGEDTPDFLTVDHINNDGYLEKNGRGRAGRPLWVRVRREGYPKDKYRILCYNCNCGRARRTDKICPHQIVRRKENG